MKKLAGVGLLLLLGLAIGNPYTQAWIAGHLVVSDDLETSDAVIPLRGYSEEERIRVEEAAQLVQRRSAPLLLVSVDSRPYFSEPVRRLIETYLQEKGFPLGQLRFCENSADNTLEEARAMRSCLRQLRAKQAIVVTSEYHTRRTRSIFRRVLAESGIMVRVCSCSSGSPLEIHTRRPGLRAAWSSPMIWSLLTRSSLCADTRRKNGYGWKKRPNWFKKDTRRFCSSVWTADRTSANRCAG